MVFIKRFVKCSTSLHQMNTLFHDSGLIHYISSLLNELHPRRQSYRVIWRLTLILHKMSERYSRRIRLNELQRPETMMTIIPDKGQVKTAHLHMPLCQYVLELHHKLQQVLWDTIYNSASSQKIDQSAHPHTQSDHTWMCVIKMDF